MSSILKVKDLDGNIYEIPAFKGRKGDDGLSVYTSTSTEFLDKSSFYMNISEINIPDNRVLQIDDLIFCPRLGKVYLVKEINKFNQARLNFLYNLKGEKGDSGIYIGSGDMPDGYNVQINPDGEVTAALPAEYISYSNEEGYAEATNVKEALDIMGNVVLSIIDDLVSNTDRITTLEKTLGDIENGYY